MRAETRTQESIPLDKVMLAMDVVDTLRHQRALVESELDGEQRERRLIARVQSVYESQGMEVPESVIAEGVKALIEDRFTYDPPVRSFAVRMAEVYVERRRWALRLSILLLVASAVWASFAIPAYYARQSLIRDFREVVAETQTELTQLIRRAKTLQGNKAALLPVAAAKAESEIMSDITLHLKQSEAGIREAQEAMDPGPDPELYPKEQERLDGMLTTQAELLARITIDLRSVDDWLQLIRALRSVQDRSTSLLARLPRLEIDAQQGAQLNRMGAELTRLVDQGELESAKAELRRMEVTIRNIIQAERARASRRTRLERLSASMNGVDLAPAVRREYEGLVRAAKQAVDAGIGESADARLTQLESLVQVLDQSYELRIFTRRGKRSGVWRYPNARGRTGPRNYYIVVEAIGPNGRHVRLPITNEENQRVSRVSVFAIRVTEDAFEGVKKDKLDNGIIDNRLFGVKKRGEREPEYRFPVAGGMITRW